MPGNDQNNNNNKAPTAARCLNDAQTLVSRAQERAETLGPEREFGDFSHLTLKEDHASRPCWTCPDGSIFLEAFHELYHQAYDFLVTIAEPVARPAFLHQYKLRPMSLYAAVATNISTETILQILQRLSKNVLPDPVRRFVQDCTSKNGKVKLVLQNNRLFVESEHPGVLRELLRDPVIAQARIQNAQDREFHDGAAIPGRQADGPQRVDEFLMRARAEEMQENLHIWSDDDDDDTTAAADQRRPRALVAFEIDPQKVELVKRQAMEMNYPLMDEYDFRKDRVNANIPNFHLKPSTRIRQYQERSLSKMFGNGRARSGMIVLPCGAGKTLTGVTAAQTIQKSCVCLATSAVSVHQWKSQFQKWTDIPDDRISVFTGDRKDPLHPEACVLITTYTMIAYSGLVRSKEAQKIMDQITSREWGLLLMDEVHVVPARIFRNVIGTVKAHCRLGLTATLVREDGRINDLNFLIGPKLYEANWMDLTAQGYLANVQCVEVRCPMTGPFMEEYLRPGKSSRVKQLLYTMNPSKLRTAEFLVRFHEARGDKIILFSDSVFALKLYAKMLKRPMIYGETPEWERKVVLGLFRSSDKIQTICLSKVGDVSIDLPEANVILQVSSHFGARRQEAQRLGRILRPKSYTRQDGSNRSSYNASFNTLVSADTEEMFYSAKRQRYLIDQGYTYKVLSNLCAKADKEAAERDYAYNSPQKDRELLNELIGSEMDAEREEKAEILSIRKKDSDAAGLTANNTHSGNKRPAAGISVGSPRVDGASSRVAKRIHPLFQNRGRR